MVSKDSKNASFGGWITFSVSFTFPFSVYLQWKILAVRSYRRLLFLYDIDSKSDSWLK